MIGWVILGIAGVAALASLIGKRNQETVSSQDQNPDTPTVEPGPVSATPKGGPSQFDDLILSWARTRNLDPVLVKAVIAKESYFDPQAVNPEKSGLSANAVRNAILSDDSGGDAALSQLKINPSLGLMQVRVTTAREYLTLNPVDLFDPETNIRAGTGFLSWLASKGITLSSIDAYNVGYSGYSDKGFRNAAYQRDVSNYYAKFQNDFGG